MHGAGAQLRAALVVMVVSALAACSHFRDPVHVRPGPIYSPNGEPLSGGPLGAPGCADAMQLWLARIDSDHDGTVDLREFLADARRQFAVMDIDKSGVLTPSVLAQYRAPYLADQPSDQDREKIRRERQRRGETEPPISEDRADPVMLADVNLRNRVTLDGFLAYARQNFSTLDRNRDGRLDQDEARATCKP